MRLVKSTSAYRKSYKRLFRSGRFPNDVLEKVIKTIMKDESLPMIYHDHELLGKFMGHRECHIKSDLLLVYKIEDNSLLLVLVNLGSHSELFK